MNIDHLSEQKQDALHAEIDSEVHKIFATALVAYNEKNYIRQGTTHTGKRMGAQCFFVIKSLYSTIFDQVSGPLIGKHSPQGATLHFTSAQMKQWAESILISRDTLKSHIARLSDAGLLSSVCSGNHISIRLSIEIQSKIDEICKKFQNQQK